MKSDSKAKLPATSSEYDAAHANGLKWRRRYYALASHVAQWSKDPRTKVGAVVIGEDPRNLTVGYNGFPSGIADTQERLDDPPVKYKLMQHAERNALDNARFDLRGGAIVSTMFPCVECAKTIISRGIACVVCPPAPPPIAEPSWRDDLALSREILEEAGVKIVTVEATGADGERSS